MTEKMLIGKNEYQDMDLEKEKFKSELLSLKQEVMNVETKSEISNLRIDRSLNYLRSLIKNGNYSELMEQNSKEIVKAVQILLKNKGYKLDKIDGILLPEGKTTSGTVEAIKKFQRDNGLNDDGILGESTIQKILDIYKNWVTYEEYRSLSSKDSLTDHEFELIMNFGKKNGYIELNVESITDKQAEELSKVDTLSLDGLVSITDNQAEKLGKVFKLSLNGLESITDKQAEELSKVNNLRLNGLESITDKQAEELGKVYDFALNGLKRITDKQAEKLSRVYSLRLNGLESITDKQAEELGKVSDLYLNGLKSITDKQAEELGKVSDLYLDGLESITNKQAEKLGKVFKLSLNGLNSITDKQVEKLSRVSVLSLDGLMSITDKHAKILSRVPRLRVPEKILTQQQREILSSSLHRELLM